MLITINGISYPVDFTEFTSLLNQLELQGKKLRLLSCGSELSGKAISQQLNCQVIACEGKVNLYKNGKFESAENKPWKWFDRGADGVASPPSSKQTHLQRTREFVTLSTEPIRDFRNFLIQNNLSGFLTTFNNVFDDALRTKFILTK